jgi:hypothetical protein
LAAEAISATLDEVVELQDLDTDALSERVNGFLIDKLLERLSRPGLGMHLTAGILVGPPRWPVKAFAESKLMIPFTRIDPAIDLHGGGFILNAGVALVL